VVTLQKRVSKNIYELEKVRLEPRPALEIDTAQEAKHWAATYALFRVSS
jgi:ATP-dependent RNA helicase DHX57